MCQKILASRRPLPFMLNEKNFFVDNLAIGAKYHKKHIKNR